MSWRRGGQEFEGVPSPYPSDSPGDRHWHEALHAGFGVWLQEQHLEEWRKREKMETLSCKAAAAEASDNPTGSSGMGWPFRVILPWEGGMLLYTYVNQSRFRPFLGRGMILGEGALCACGSPREEFSCEPSAANISRSWNDECLSPEGSLDCRPQSPLRTLFSM